MARGGATRFQKGQSGNPKGRPKRRRPNVSAFDIIIDKTLTVTQNGVERELSVDEALRLQTYREALKGSKMAIRQVLKMIEKREAALAKLHPSKAFVTTVIEYESDNADEAMRILGIATDVYPHGPQVRRLRLQTWAAQAGLSRAGRRTLSDNEISEIERCTLEPGTLRWPRRRTG